MSEAVSIIKSRVKVSAAVPPMVAPAKITEAIPAKPRAKAAPLLRFIAKGFFKSDEPLQLAHRLLALGWRASDDVQRGEIARLYRAHARVYIRSTGYVYAGGQGGDALDQLDKLSRGQQ